MPESGELGTFTVLTVGNPASGGFPAATLYSTGSRHIHDMSADERTMRTVHRLGDWRHWRCHFSVRVPVGAIAIRRNEVRPFAGEHISLLKTFAAQAVIAIENVRLFQELTEALETGLPRVKSWVSLPARRRIFSRFWNTIAGKCCPRCAALYDALDSTSRGG